MSKEKEPYNPVPGDYDTDKLTDLHSSETEPSSYARNIKQGLSKPHSKNDYNSSDRSAKLESKLDPTERIPSLIKYSNMNRDDKYDKRGEI